MRKALASAIHAAVRAADPVLAYRDLIARQPTFLSDALCTGGSPPPPCVYLLGAGKASAGLLVELVHALGGLQPPLLCAGGVLVTKDGHVDAASRALLEAHHVAVHEASHPVPDARGEAGAQAMLNCLQAAPPHAAVVFVISGGASALLPLPVPGVTLADLQALGGALLASGAPIEDVNAVRKHLSRVAGGQLGAAASAATQGGPLLTFLVSDVVGGALHAIGSGPTLPDPTTFAEARAVLARHAITPPPAIAAHLAASSSSSSETLKHSLPRHTVHTLASNAQAVAAAAEALQAAGYDTRLQQKPLLGLVTQAAPHCAAQALAALQAQLQRSPGDPPLALLYGGETTVDLQQQQEQGEGEGEGGAGAGAVGLGGRNTELALLFGLEMRRQAVVEEGGGGCGWEEEGEGVLEGHRQLPLPWAAAFLATDGGDGPTDAAGAVVTADTPVEARSAEQALLAHDTYTYFRSLGEPQGVGVGVGEGGQLQLKLPRQRGGLIKTGPTGTNVCDVAIVLLWGQALS